MERINSLTIVVPALNEEKSLGQTVTEMEKALGDNNIDWEIVIVNDGSRDKTGKIAEELAVENNRIKVIHHNQPLGIGSCFRNGIKVLTKEAITWLPADGENSPYEIIKYLSLLEHVDIIVPFVLNKRVRNLRRRIFSSLYLLIINFSFGTTFNYTNGNVIYKRHVFNVVKPKSNGFFFQTECLIKAIRSGFIFAEVPVLLLRRKQGGSKAMAPKSFYRIMLDFLRLFIEIYILRTTAKIKINS